MRIYAGIDPSMPLSGVRAYAARVEALGFDGLHVAETVNDSFLAAALAIEHTTTLIVRTAVTIAFPRSPMITAYAAWGLAAFSGGRFQLGLGTQVKGNIERRFSVPWSDPSSRMREYIEALRAIFHSFATGEQLSYEGHHYRFSRLQPIFNPGPHPYADIKIFLGGVNERMSTLAAQIADGLITHPTSSHPRFLDTVCAPALRDAQPDFELIASPIVIGGVDAHAVGQAREVQRGLLAFLYSTPAYRTVLDLFGWGSVGEELHSLSRRGRWDEMRDIVTDDIVDTLTLRGTYDELPAVLDGWFRGRVQGLVLHPPEDPTDDPAFARAVAQLRRA